MERTHNYLYPSGGSQMLAKYKIQKIMGPVASLNALDRISIKVSGVEGLPIEQARRIVEQVYHAALLEFVDSGVLRLPYGVTSYPASKIRKTILEKYRCTDPAAVLGQEAALDPPFTLFKTTTIVALLGYDILEQLHHEGITTTDLAKCLTKSV